MVSVLILFIALLSREIIPVNSAATFISSREGWKIAENSNVTLDCRIFISNGPSSHYSCPVISFTWNGTIIAENPKHLRSGPTYADNNVICTMTMRRVESEDSGAYGCCSTDKTTGMCYKHPTKELYVMPRHTTVPTTLETMSTKAATTTTTTTATYSPTYAATTPLYVDNPVSPVDVTHNLITELSEKNSSLSKSDNIAQMQHTMNSIHKTVWPVLLAAILLITIIVLGTWRHIRKNRAAKSKSQNITGATEYHSVESETKVEKG